MSVPPLAITNLTAAITLRGPAPIDAVRIRVSGIADFSPESQRRVEEVGTALAAMGLDVDVVAGSSPQTVELLVPGYFVESGSDLGYVRQDWTTLGVAERITTSLESINAAIIGLALAATAILLTTLAQVDLVSRRREALVLKSIGWTRIRLIAWFMAQPLVGTVVVLGGATAVWVVSRGSATGLLAAAGLAGTIGIVGFVSALLTVDPSIRESGFSAAHLPPSRVARVIPARGTWGLALRFALSSPVRLGMVSATMACGAAALVLAGQLVASAGAAAGPTALADFVLRGNRPFQLGILGGTSGASLLAAAVALRAASSSLEPSVLVAGGWVPRDVQRVRLAFHGLVGAVGAVLAAAVVWVGAWFATDAEAIVSPIASALLAMAIPVALFVMPSKTRNAGLR